MPPERPATQPDATAEHQLAAKLQIVHGILCDLGRVGVAFSGGVDSTFVLRVAVDALGRDNVVAFTGTSHSVAASELDEARRLAELIGARHVVVPTREFEDPNYLANPTNRCYYCKSELYSRLGPLLAEHGLRALVTGTNADDLDDHRPGLIAADERNVRAPAAEAGLTKADIRIWSARWGLPTADKPASPCLSSRVQYGESITPEKLRMIERGERILSDLGIRECRVRHHNDLARIEVPPNQIAMLTTPDVRARLDAEFRRIGYAYVTIDLRGFRSGSMNEVIAFGRVQPVL